MRRLEIVFTRSKKRFAIFSWLIMLWTKRPYSHVARKSLVREQIPLYYQANEGKVNYEHESVFNRKHKTVKTYTILIPDLQYREISDACLMEAGKKYAAMQNISIMLIDLGITEKPIWKDGRNCSELLYVTVLKEIFKDLDYNPDTIKPSDIESIILDRFEERGGLWCVKA